MKLLSLAEYDALSSFEKGYATYMQAEWPGSPIPKKNPYVAGSPDHAAWENGGDRAALHVQDMEE